MGCEQCAEYEEDVCRSNELSRCEMESRADRIQVKGGSRTKGHNKSEIQSQGEDDDHRNAFNVRSQLELRVE